MPNVTLRSVRIYYIGVAVDFKVYRRVKNIERRRRSKLEVSEGTLPQMIFNFESCKRNFLCLSVDLLIKLYERKCISTVSARLRWKYPLIISSEIALQVVRTSFPFHLENVWEVAFPPSPPLPVKKSA